jgi:hypothetical protein
MARPRTQTGYAIAAIMRAHFWDHDCTQRIAHAAPASWKQEDWAINKTPPGVRLDLATLVTNPPAASGVQVIAVNRRADIVRSAGSSVFLYRPGLNSLVRL